MNGPARQFPGESWLETGIRILMPELPLLAGPQLCGVCGADPTCCPTCGGAGEVCEDDGLARGRNDSPDEHIVERRCPTCLGNGRHVCLPRACFYCGREAQVFDRLTEMHLCTDCHRRVER